MLCPQPSYVCEERLEQIAAEMEEIILDAILTALQGLNRQNRRIREQEEKLSNVAIRWM